MTDTNKEREAFEAWARDDFYSGFADIAGDRVGTSYRDMAHHMAWYAYQAGRSSLAASAAGCQHESDGFTYTSIPPKKRCKKCGAIYTLGEPKAASAGSEPVAWMNDEGDVELNHKPWMSDVWKPLYTHPSPPEGAGWRPIAEAPQNGRTLLLGYFNSAGKWRTTRGQWMSQDYIDEYAEDPDCMSPGWYETTVEGDDGKCWPIDPTHFMPVPPAPPASEAKGVSK